jgi:hypothetical protein
VAGDWTTNGNRLACCLLPLSLTTRPGQESNRLTHECELKDELDRVSVARPLALMRAAGRTVLALDDPGGEPPDHCSMGL